MIRSFIIACCLFFGLTAAAQSTKNYRVAISFQSECCGVPDNAPVLQYVKEFKLKHKVKKISYDHIGPLGREGEYNMAFSLNELCKSNRKKFIAGLKSLVPALKDKGSASLQENYTLDTSSLGRATISKKQL